jgi:hypothetical protein
MKKCLYMIINLNDRNIQDMNISIDGQLLTRVNVVKIVGIYFDDRICFDHHIDKTSSKVLQRIGVLSKKLLICVYNAIVMPVFDYGSIVYGFTYSSHLSCLETLQKKAIRIICSAGFRAQSRPIFQSLKVMPLFDRIKYNSFIFIFKSLNKLSSCFSHDFFKFASHSRRTRSELLSRTVFL